MAVRPVVRRVWISYYNIKCYDYDRYLNFNICCLKLIHISKLNRKLNVHQDFCGKLIKFQLLKNSFILASGIDPKLQQPKAAYFSHDVVEK